MTVEKTEWVSLTYSRQDDPPFSEVHIRFMEPNVEISGGYDGLDQPFGHPLARLVAKGLGEMDDIGLFGIYLSDPDDGMIYIDINNVKLSVHMHISDFVKWLKVFKATGIGALWRW